MLLTLDIGNSAAKGGLFDGDRIHRVFHVDVSVRDASSAVATERWVQALKPHLETDAGKRVERVGITTVVPDVLPAAQTALRNLTGRPITVLHPNMSLPFTLGYDTPQTLGMDRLAAAAAAWVRWDVRTPAASLRWTPERPSRTRSLMHRACTGAERLGPDRRSSSVPSVRAPPNCPRFR